MRLTIGCILLTWLTITPIAPAQRLDLGGTSGPEAPSMVVEHVDRILEEQIEVWSNRLASAESVSATDDRLLALRTMIAWRVMARRLLNDDLTPLHIMRGLMMAGEVEQLDALVQQFLTLSNQRDVRPTGARYRRVRASLSAFVNAAERAAEPPESIEALDTYLGGTIGRLVPAASELQRVPHVDVWIRTDDADERADRELIDRFQSTSPLGDALDASVQSSLDAFVSRLLRASEDPALRPRALDMLHLIDRAAAGSSIIIDTPWLEETVRQRAHDLGWDAIGRLPDRSAREESVATIDALLVVVDALDRMEKISDLTRPQRTTLERAAGSVLERVTDTSQRDAGLRAAAAFVRILDVMVAYRSIPDRAEGAWQMRVAWRLLHQSYTDAEARMIEMLEELLNAPDRLHMPSVVSMIARHRDAYLTLVRVHDLPALMASLRATNRPERIACADRLDVLIDEVAEEMTRIDALAALESFDRGHRLYGTLSCEAPLRRDDRVYGPMLDGRGAEFLRLIEVDRAAWYAAWAAKGDLAAPARRLDTFRRISAMLEAYRALRDDTLPVRVSRWAALEPGSGSIKRIRDTLPDAMDEGMTLLFEGRNDLAAESIAFAENASGFVRLMATVAERIPSTWTTDQRTMTWILAELTQPPDAGAWLGAERVAMADLSRWTMELRLAVKQERRNHARLIVSYLDDTSRTILDRLDVRSSELPVPQGTMAP